MTDAKGGTSKVSALSALLAKGKGALTTPSVPPVNTGKTVATANGTKESSGKLPTQALQQRERTYSFHRGTIPKGMSPLREALGKHDDEKDIFGLQPTMIDKSSILATHDEGDEAPLDDTKTSTTDDPATSEQAQLPQYTPP